jgi:hypothetical protein
MFDLALSADGNTLNVTTDLRHVPEDRRDYKVTVVVVGTSESRELTASEQVAPAYDRALTITDTRPNITWVLTSDDGETAVYTKTTTAA